MCYSHLGVELRFNFRRSGCGSLKDSSYDAEVAGYHAENPWRVISGEAQQIERYNFMNDRMELRLGDT